MNLVGRIECGRVGGWRGHGRRQVGTGRIQKSREEEWQDTDSSGVSGRGESTSIDSVLRLARSSEPDQLEASIDGDVGVDE
jgi:hypothetical protein